jgi:hypothetical protein
MKQININLPAIKNVAVKGVPFCFIILELMYFAKIFGSVPEVVEKGIGISYPIEKPTNKKGGYTDEKRIPQRTGINHVRAGVIAGRACRPAAGAIRPGGSQAAANGRFGGRGDCRTILIAMNYV